jgi:hypothetical protein
MQRLRLHHVRSTFGIIALLSVVLGGCNPTNPITPPDPPQPTGIYPWRVWTPEIPVVPPSSTGATYYVDGTNGKDTNNGTSAITALKTIAKSLELIAAGDTVLIRKGLYREGINLTSGPSGTATKPITFGSYGDGEVILDGSNKTGVWELVSGTVWKTKKSDWQAGQNIEPIAVVVNDVALKQVTQGQNGSAAPQVGLAGVSSGSGKWHNGTAFITADMGSVDPNTADIVMPKLSQDQTHVYFYNKEYVTFKGLTIRGSGSNGIWGYGSHIAIESCNIKFNGKAAVSFFAGDAPNFEGTDNAVLTSNIYQNVLVNWPRGNNGYAESGGGWPGTLAWSGNARGIARGNIIHLNGGEGIASYLPFKGNTNGILVEQNVVSDNWSVDVYIDNHQNAVIRNNLIYNHPIDYNPSTTNFLYVGKPYPFDQLGKFSVGIGIGDESYGVGANLANTQVYNNIIAGVRTGILDYAEGNADAAPLHGLKNALIANNTIIMPFDEFPGTGGTYGIKLRDNLKNNVNTVIANNLIYGTRNQDPLMFSEFTGRLDGITLKNNLYFNLATTKPFGSVDLVNGSYVEKTYTLSEWKTNTGSETNSLFQDPLLESAAHFGILSPTLYKFDQAKPKAGSPAIGAGTPMPFTPAVDFELKPRVGWNIGAF